MIDQILVITFTALVALAPIPATIASIYLYGLSQEQGGKSWLLRMLWRGSAIKAVAVWIISFFVVRSFVARLIGLQPLPVGLGSTVIGIALLGIELVSVYYALVIRSRRKAADSHINQE